MFAMRLLMIITVVIPCVCSQLNPNTYGPFKVSWRSYELCSGPKKENLTHITKSLLVENDVYKGVINITFPANTRIDEIKMLAIVSNNTKTKPITWNYMVKKPCQHYSIGWLLATHLNADHCVVKKGYYHTVVDFTDAANKFFGNKFFYGEFTFKILVLSNKGNIACMIFNPIFSKA